MEANNELKLKEKLGFGAFSGSYNLAYFFKSSYYLFFLTNVLGLSVGTAGILIAAGAVWDAVNDPLIGYLTVNHKNRRGEHIRYLTAWFCVPCAVLLVLLFTNFHVSDTAAILISAVVFFLYDTCFTCLGIDYSTMATVATDDQKSRLSLNVFNSIGSNLGTVIGTLACFPLLNAFGALDADGNLIPESADRGFRQVAIIFAVIIVAGALVHYFTTRERVRPENEEEKTGFGEMLKTLFGYGQYLLNTVQTMTYNTALIFMTSVITYYATYVTGSTAMTTYYQAAYILGMLIGAIALVQPVDRKLGHKKTMLLGATLFAVAKIPFVILPESPVAVFTSFGLSGIGAAFLYVTISVFFSNICDNVELRSGKRMDASLGTVSGFIGTISAGLATEILALVLQAAKFDADLAVQPASAISAIKSMLGWVPLVLSVLLLVFTWFVNVEPVRKAEEAGSGAEA